MMFPIVESKANRMIEFLNSKESKEIVEMKDIFSSYTTESIASIAFGNDIECQGNPDNPFRKVTNSMFEPSAMQKIKQFLQLSENLANVLKLSWTSREISDFFTDTVRQTLEYREQNKIQQNDFLDVAMKLMKNGELTFDEVAANCFNILIAG